MGSGWRGVATGALSLVALELVVQPNASSRLGGLFAVPGNLARSFLSPNVPAFKTSASSAKPASTSTGTGTTTPATTGTITT